MARLVVRADANSTIGFGHVMRCLAITNGSANYDIHWYSVDPIESTLQAESIYPITFHQIHNEAFFHSQIGPNDVVILDGYSFTSMDQQVLHSTGALIVLIDDLADKTIHADLVINPTPGFRADLYHSSVNTIFLMGFEYALLRQPFIELAKSEHLEIIPNSVLLCFGGSDPFNHTEKVLKYVLNESFSSIHVVLGSGYQFHESLLDYQDPRIKLHQHLNAREMADCMAQCEWGIYPCSGILLEGLAAQQHIIGGMTIDNQKWVYAAHKSLGTIIDAADFSPSNLKIALANRAALPMNAKQWIDGRSIERIHRMIDRIRTADDYHLRKANAKDVDVTYSWAKEPNVRKYAFQQHEITLEEHQKWFLTKVKDQHCLYYIFEINNEAIGSIRFDITDSQAVISYLLAPHVQGKGLGLILLKKGMDRLQSDLPNERINQFVGDVMMANQGSVRIFEQLGYRKEITEKGVRYTKTLH